MRATLLLLSLLCVGLVQAQTFRWVDQDGKVHFGDRPPPTAAGKVQERKPMAPAADKQVSYAMRQAMTNFPVTLYVSKNCGEGCKDGHDYLNKRGVPFSEKTVSTQEDIDALKKLSGGSEAEVPVLQVGPKHARGWLQSEWQRLLDAAGYPKSPAVR